VNVVWTVNKFGGSKSAAAGVVSSANATAAPRSFVLIDIPNPYLSP
jgi:hypothetical protein